MGQGVNQKFILGFMAKQGEEEENNINNIMIIILINIINNNNLLPCGNRLELET